VRSTRGRKRSDAHNAPHYTDGAHRITAPLASSTPAGRRLGNSGPVNMLNSRSKGWHTPSMNYHAREGAGQ
jgi:hypothetical protein